MYTGRDMAVQLFGYKNLQAHLWKQKLIFYKHVRFTHSNQIVMVLVNIASISALS